MKNCCGVEKESVSDDCKDDYNKGGIGRWKFTEIEELVFTGDCSISCMHNWGCDNEKAFCRKFSIFLIEDRVVVDHVI